jgi:hypothetical protein
LGQQAELVLTPEGGGECDGRHRITWRISEPGAEDRKLWHAVPLNDAALLGDGMRGDAALATVLLHAMRRGLPIRIHGHVSPTLLCGLERMQEVWTRWRPGAYRAVGVRADHESEVAAQTDNGALCAFSGGVDATFSLFRHLQGQAGRGSRRISGALLVHGLDIPLDRPAEFEAAAASARSLLATTDIPLLVMQTNARSLGQHWEDAFGLILSGCFLQLQGHYSVGMRGSEEPYESLILPWGSTPLTDAWCSTAAMAMEHDGCGFDRCEKIHWLATNTDCADALRVCWEGPHTGVNCGQCEKCVRTKLNFWAMGLPQSRALPGPLSSNLVRTLRARNEVQLAYIQSIYRHGRSQHGDRNSISSAVRRVLMRAQVRNWVGKGYRLIRGRGTDVRS